jgi:putative alpha-1,2-mannosidase
VRRRHLSLLAALFLIPAQAHADDLARHVDPMIGTMAPGFTVPGAVAPFGMVQNSPDTLGPLVYSGYMHHDALIRGFSLVHLSGPGVAKAGDLPFMPWTGPGAPPDTPEGYASPYTHVAERASAGFYEVTLGNGVTTELTAGKRIGIQRHTFPAAGDAYLVVDPWHRNGGTADDAGWEQTGPREISGWTRSRYPVFFVARFDQDIVETGDHWLKFAQGSTVTMQAGISFVDAAGARENLDSEAGPFEAVQAKTYAAWNRMLEKVPVTGGTDLDRRSFYTALYHSLLHPNVFSDVDGRYRGFDDQVHQAGAHEQYANFSSWDTYKATNQLQAMVVPGRYADMLRSLLRDAQQGGRLPRWAEQSVDASHMSGDPAIPMIADGACRGLINRGLTEQLYDEAVELRTYRDPALDALGYLPGRPGTTLEYGIADFALALLADRLGKDEDAQRWLAASLNYRNLLDDQGWIHPRDEHGAFKADFDPTLADQGFQEGNSWQYTWLVPHDIGGLLERIGLETARQRLDVFFSGPAEVQTKATFFGVYYTLPQWAPGNEHDISAPYVWPYLGEQHKLATEMLDARTLYRPTVDGLPGNDDLGGLSAWYVFIALGVGPFVPGAPLHMVGTPQFTGATIGDLTITTSGSGPFVQSATLDGEPLGSAWFAERGAGALHLELGLTPNAAWGTATAPPSASDASLEAFGCVH